MESAGTSDLLLHDKCLIRKNNRMEMKLVFTMTRTENCPGEGNSVIIH